MLLIVCLLLPGGAVSYAKNGGNRDDQRNVKSILVKYKDSSKNIENHINSRKKDGRLKRSKQLNRKKMYSFEIDSSQMNSFLKDKEIELVEEDTVVQMFGGAGTESCSGCAGENCENCTAESCPDCGGKNGEDCTVKSCLDCEGKNGEDCTAESCFDCAGECSGDGTGEVCSGCTGESCAECPENGCDDCGPIVEWVDENYVFPEPEQGEEGAFWRNYEPCCDKHSFDCLENGVCCDQCIFNDLFQGRFEIFTEGIEIPPQMDPLPVDQAASSSALGDKLPWNIVRTGADRLQEQNLTGSGIKVAVFDTGISLNNSDLKVAGGVSFVEGVTSYDDDHGHGTAMAGIIAAGLNGSGLAGMAPDAQLYSVKVLDKDGFGRYSGIIQGIQWAIENGMDIISLSLGGLQYSQILKEAIDQAVANDILVIAAAGNNNNGQIMYPAAYAQVICVGATNSNNTKGVFSNYGSQVDISAPGSGIETTGLGNTTTVVSGTSPAAAHVAGAAALIWGRNRALTNGHIKYLLYRNAYDLGNYNSFGHGIVDVVKAYQNMQNGNYEIYIEDTDGGHFIEDAVGEGWDGIVYAQACKHIYTKLRTKPATCTNPGYIELQCVDCGSTRRDPIDAYGHNYQRSSSMAPTCTKDGFATYTCTRCSASYTNTLTKTGHKYTKTSTTAAKCDAEGYTSYKCDNCSSTKKDNIVKPTGHSMKPEITKSATCTELGSKKYTCGNKNCTYSYSESIPKDPNNHTSWKAVSQGATCTAAGYTRDECSGCHAIKNEKIIPKKDHSWQKVSETASTCTQAGSIAYKCTVCAATKTEPKAIPGHDYVSYYSSPGCTSYGESGERCRNCSATRNVSSISPTGHSYSYSVSSTHSSNGHSYKNSCSRCGTVSSSGYTTVSSCLSCTTPPSVSFYNISGSTVLQEKQTKYAVQVRVIDNENDNLTCIYYLDGSASPSGTVTATNTKAGAVVSFPTGINASALSEGNHTIRATAKDSVAPMGETSVAFKVDKSAPTISKVTVTPDIFGVKLTVSAADTVSGLAAAAYRYTVDGVASQWLSESTFTKSGLTANASHSYTVEVRDNTDHIASSGGTFVTAADKPVVTVNALPCEGLRIIIKDSNPAGTWYSVQVGSSYANASGGLSASQVWIQPGYDNTYAGKAVLLNSLQPGTQYGITVAARNVSGTGSVAGNSVTARTSPAAPGNLRVSEATSSYISLLWNAADGAATYDIYRETLSAQGAVTAAGTIPGVMGTFYQDKNVAPGTSYRYKLRSADQSGNYGSWSQTQLTAATKPLPPAQVKGLKVSMNGCTLSVSWEAIGDAIGYEAEIVCNGTVTKLYSRTPEITFDTKNFNSQCNIKIRAFNVCDPNRKEEATLWSNAGLWSDTVTDYTHAETPVAREVKAEEIRPDSVRIVWEAGRNPLSVEYKLAILEAGQQVKETAYIKTLEYLVTGLKADTGYTFRVKARNVSLEETEWSNEVTARTLINVPKIPQGLRAAAKEEGIMLSWEASEGASHYRIVRDGIVIEENRIENTYLDTRVTPEQEYTYAVMAVNTSGESGYSQPLTKKALGELPKVPEIRVVSGGSISVAVDWEPIEHATGYELELDGQVRNMGMETAYEHLGLLPGTEHTYRVRARNNYGKSRWSDTVTVRTEDIAPVTPGELTAAASEKEIYLHWSSTPNTIYYELSINETVISPIFSSEYLLIPEEEGALYEIRVRSVNDGGGSGWSGTVMTALDTGAGPAVPIAVPAIPELFAASGVSGITVTWSVPEGAAFYQLEADGTLLYDGPANRYHHGALAEGSSHSYRVRAGNISGFGEWSIPVTTTAGILTHAPSNISYLRQEEGKLLLTWDGAQGIPYYVVEVNGTSGEPVSKVSAVIEVKPGTVYRIRIAAVTRDSEGKDYYEWSEEISFTAARALPGAPEIKEVKAGYDSVRITLEEVEEATGYILELDGVQEDAGNSLTILRTGLASSGSYEYRVRSYNEAGEGEWSKTYTVMTGGALPGVPLNITAQPVKPGTAVTGSAITLKWDSVEGAEGYEVENENGVLFRTVETQLIIDNLTPGIPHYFRIRAVKGGEAGAFSSLIRVVPVVTSPGNAAVTPQENAVRISWDAVGGTTCYEVEINGILAGITTQNHMDFSYPVFYMERNIRIRACQGEEKGSWSETVNFKAPLPVRFLVEEGEEFSCLLPVQNVKDLGNYKLSLTYNNSELELLDGCELTKAKETGSCYITEIRTRMLIETEGNKTTVIFLPDGKGGSSFTGNAGRLRFRSKVGAEVTLTYGVTLK